MLFIEKMLSLAAAFRDSDNPILGSHRENVTKSPCCHEASVCQAPDAKVIDGKGCRPASLACGENIEEAIAVEVPTGTVLSASVEDRR